MKKIIAILLTTIMAFSSPTFTNASTSIMDGEISGEIVVSCYETAKYKGFLETVAKIFEEKYPGTSVRIDGFSALPEVRTVIVEDNFSSQLWIADSDPMAESDYISRINVEMMSGGGADIYLIDILPYYKYAESGQFVDLRELMDSDPSFDYDDYQKSIFDAAMYRGGLYILPFDYRFNIMSCNKELMDESVISNFDPFGKNSHKQLVDYGLDTFLENSNPDAERPVKLLRAPNEYYLFKSLLELNYNYLVDIAGRKANFTDGVFTSILNTAMEYKENDYFYIEEPIPELDSSTRSTTGGMYTFSTNTDLIELFNLQLKTIYIYKTNFYYNLLRSFIQEDPNTKNNLDEKYFQKTISEQDRYLNELYIGITKNDEVIGLLSNDNGDVPVTITQSYAMNTNSTNKRAAWEFMKLLLSEEIQASYIQQNLPINKNAIATIAKREILNAYIKKDIEIIEVGTDHAEIDPPNSLTTEDHPEGELAENQEETLESIIDIDISEIDPFNTFTIEDRTEEELTERQQETLEKYLYYIDTYSSMLNICIIRDVIIDDMIEKEVLRFFHGSRTADEVAETLQNKVNMYLQE